MRRYKQHSHSQTINLKKSLVGLWVGWLVTAAPSAMIYKKLITMLSAWQSGTTGAFQSPRDNTAGDVIYRMNTCLSVLPVRLRLAIGLKLLWVSPIQSKLTIQCIRLRSFKNLPIAGVFFFFVVVVDGQCRWFYDERWPLVCTVYSSEKQTMHE